MSFLKKKKTCSFVNCFTASSLLRYGLGILLLFAGFGKFQMGIDMVATSTAEGYGATLLPVVVAKYFMYVLPFIEVILGAWLISGLMKKYSFRITGILFLILIVGLLIKGDSTTINQIFVYLLITSAGMKMENENEK